MFKRVCFLVMACAAGIAAAQAPAHPDPADPKAGVPVRSYESAFENYRPYVDPDLARWRDVNDEVGRLNGHVGHVPQRAGTAAKQEAKPPPQGDDGGRK